MQPHQAESVLAGTKPAHRVPPVVGTVTGVPDGRDAVRDATRAAARATDHLLSLQQPGGWWKGDFETNVTMDTEDLLLREFLGIRTAEQTRATAAWIRSKQRSDGTWSVSPGGAADLSTTIEGYIGLRLDGDDPLAPHMARAAAWIRAQGGVARSRTFTRIWLALFGWWKWEDLPELPPELIYLPKWAPLNIYSFSCWARQAIVPLTIVCAHRPTVPAPFTLDELHTDPARPNPAVRRSPPMSWEGGFQRLDRLLHRWRTVAPPVLRRAAIRTATAWIIRRQEADGCFNGIQPPLVYSIIALRLCGFSLNHPVLRAALKAADAFLVHTPDGRRWVESCQSPVWDTCLAVTALADNGLAPDHPALIGAADWLLEREVTTQGDWSVRRPRLAPGGWAFGFHNRNYPDTDDTAEVVLALARLRHPDQARLTAAVDRAVAWNIGMQSRGGGWGAYDADNVSTLAARLPFCDFGEVTDPPSADVTAHVVEMLAAVGMADHPATRTGVGWLLAEQEPDGSWYGRWGVNHVYGTGTVVPALVAAGVPAGHPAVRRAVRWLTDHQNPDGGWGEKWESYTDPAWRGRGPSTASQTAWALLGLLAAGEHDSDAVTAGVRRLAATQREDGTWDEPEYTGTGFPGDLPLNYHLYRLLFPLSALGRYLKATKPGAA
ncbi:squalene--hopene cyclase [Streptomyces beigongshangae]|uniref:squalene--hopene cyclase n=1 Tax=Streptomyces beigongshangae TaxID=2841597 RepID=UPI001C86201A|nr:squalene--hopene cyclase [Streptomyces sp. REN17]